MDYILKQDEHYVLLGITNPSLRDSSLPEIKFELHSLEDPSEPIFLGEAKSGTNTKGFLKYLALLEMHLNQANYLKIIEAFDFMHPWEKIVDSANNFDKPSLYVRKKKKDKIQAYADVIHPPIFSIEGDIRQIELWAVDKLDGDLKQWKITQDSQGEWRIKNEVLEPEFIIVLR
jgi:hypothetical protein